MSTAESVWRALVTAEAIRTAQDRGDHERVRQLRAALAAVDEQDRQDVVENGR